MNRYETRLVSVDGKDKLVVWDCKHNKQVDNAQFLPRHGAKASRLAEHLNARLAA